MKKTIMILITALPGTVLLTAFLLFAYPYGYSAAYSDFPIPKQAKIINTDITNGKTVEIYEWEPTSEDKGLPLTYQTVIRLNGWEKLEDSGHSITFKKDSNLVYISYSTDYLSVSFSHQEESDHTEGLIV